MTEQLPFHATPIGRKYYEETLPNLIKGLNRLAGALERGEIKSGKPPKAPAKFLELLKKSHLGKYRFPLFTGWFFNLLNYKMAYEFLKKKGLSKEFQMWSKDEGAKLAKIFFKEGLEMLEESDVKESKGVIVTHGDQSHPESKGVTFDDPERRALPNTCDWMGCLERGKSILISLPGGSAVRLWLCEKHKKEVARVLGLIPKPFADFDLATGHVGFDPATGQVRGYIDVEITKKEEQRSVAGATPEKLLTEAEQIIINNANKKMRNLVRGKEEEKKKKDEEFVALELSRVDVEIADLKKKLAIKRQIREKLEFSRRARSQGATNRG